MKNRVIYYDILNVISCMAVVCLHSNGFIHTFIKDDWWWLRVLIEVVFYFAVPVFFMLTGATLMDYRKRYTTKEFYKKRFLKTFIPFAAWSMVFYGAYYLNGHDDVGLREVFANVTTGHIPFTNYWFFIPLFMIYLFMPFISTMVTNMSKKQLGMLCVLLIAFQTLLPTLFQIAGGELTITLPIEGYVMFVLIGYYLARYNIEKSKTLFNIIGGGKFSCANYSLHIDLHFGCKRGAIIYIYGLLWCISCCVYFY